jgi:beta-lactamase superfamily II metal-dependent hydrolase
LFDVEHGFCAFLKSDTGCTLMIDCGKAANFSPVRYILANELNGAAIHNGYRLTQLIITYPHDDHIEDIGAVMTELPPWILMRQQYGWNEIKKPDAAASNYANLDAYSAWQARYSGPLYPVNWGMSSQPFALTPDEAKALDEAAFVNNSSYVTVVTFTGSMYQEKFLFGGDMETAGWDALLAWNAQFREAVKNVDFFIVPHHGHASGFSTKLFAAMGRKPFLNLISVTDRDEHVDGRYSCADFALGTEVGGARRYSLTTRSDGAIFVDVNSEGKFAVANWRLQPNLAMRLPQSPRLW